MIVKFCGFKTESDIKKIKNYGKIKENMKGAIVRELSISDRFLL